MRSMMLALAATLAATPAVTMAAPAPARVTVVTVEMADRGFHPQVIRLHAGDQVRLRFVNRDGSEHDFYASRLFAESRMPPMARAMLRKDRLNVLPHTERSIVLTPLHARPYDAKSTKLLDVTANMTAQVLVY